MTRLRVFFHRLRGMIFKRRLERDLEDEIRSHLEMQIEENLRQGMSREDARRAALRKFGGVEQVKEAYRDRIGLSLVESTLQDLHYGARILCKNPGFTLAAVVTLALGIGANTAIFSVVNSVLLRPLPYVEPERLVTLSYFSGGDFDFAQGADFLEWRERSKAFEQIAAYTFTVADLTGSGEPERLTKAVVSANLFSTLGVRPALGRDFTPDENKSGGAPVVILSHSLWQRRFGGDSQVIGRPITLEGKSHTVIGIMSPGFQFPGKRDLWAPLDLDDRQLSGLQVIARLKPGVAMEAARSDLSISLDRQKQAFPDNPLYTIAQIKVVRLSERLVSDVRQALLALFGAVIFLLLIACANVANLLMARASARQKEMAIRVAVGAGRFRLVRQALTESLLLSFAGGVAGVIAATWGVKLIVNMNPGGIARLDESVVDGRVLGFTCVVTALVGLIAGVLPALLVSKPNVDESLKAQSPAGRAVGSGRWTLPALVITELALTLVLSVGAGLMIKSFLNLLAVPKGFEPEGVLTLNLSPGQARYPLEAPQRYVYIQGVLERVQALPGIRYAGLTGFLPLTRPSLALAVQVEGRPVEPEKEVGCIINYVSQDYFRTMGMQMLAGRPFVAQDGGAEPQPAIINETTARLVFHNENPIGHRLSLPGLAMMQPDRTHLKIIVGMVGDTRHSGMDQEVNAELYLPYTRYSHTETSLAARVDLAQISQAGLSSLSAAIRNQAQAQDPYSPVQQVVTMEERLSDSFAPRRFRMLLFGAFAALALIIATVGIYGVISYAVSRRTNEIGIRMALGATPRDVLKMVARQGMILTLIGVTLGLAASLALTRALKSLLFNVSATDPAIFALTSLLLVTVALIAGYVPARRATKVDPLQALRHE